MSKKILLPQLVSMLAVQTGKPKKQAESFLKAYFQIITDALLDYDSVKIRDLGTFKINKVESRKSVNVSTGTEVNIPAHYKIVFTPSKRMAEKVNKEFSWLSLIDLSEEITAEDLNSVGEISKKISEPNLDVKEEVNKDDKPIGKPERISNSSNINHKQATIEIDMKEKEFDPQKENSERVGEELVREFGEIEPAEPFGPVDPMDPEVDSPIPENINKSVATPTKGSKDREFDPYAIEPVEEDNVEEEEEPVFQLSKEQLESLATKAEMKIIAKSLKKVRSNVENFDELSRERSKRTFLWTLIVCLLLLVGGFFLTYFIILHKVTERTQKELEQTEEAVEENAEEQYTLTENEESNELTDSMSNGTAPENKNQDKMNTSAAPTQPSDIKATDRITTTRYLTTMAKEYYGNYNLWPYIYLENEDKLGHPDRIKPGTTVVIPNIEKYNVDPNNPKDIEKAKKLGVEIYKRYVQN